MASFLQELVDRKATLIEQTRSIAKDLVDAPAAEKQERYDRAKADLSAVLGQIEDEEERSATEADLAEQRAKLEASARPTTSGPQGPEDRSLAEITEFFTFENARKQFVMKRPERRDAVNITIADTTAKGAYTVAEDFYDQVQMHKVAMNPFYDTQATILRTKNGNDIVIPKTTADPAAALTAEVTAATKDHPTFGEVTLKNYRIDGYYLASLELLRDTSVVDFVGLLAKVAGRAIGTKTADQFTDADGSDKPQGIVPVTTLGVTAASATDTTMNEWKRLMLSVIAPYRQVGEWMASDGAYQELSLFTDDNGNYQWQPSNIAGEPDALFGKRLHTNANMDDPASAKKTVLFGDLSTFWIREVGDLLFERDDSIGFKEFAVYFRWAQWVDSELIDTTGAVKHLLMAT